MRLTMGLSILETIFTIAFANNLSHIVYVSDLYTGGVTGEGRVKMIDISCGEYLFRDAEELSLLTDNNSVINIFMECDRSLIYESFRYHDVEATPFPLIYPLHNVIFLRWNNDTGYTLQDDNYFGNALIKDAYYLLPTPDTSVTTDADQKCMKAMVKNLLQVTVASVDDRCTYHGLVNLLSDQFTGFGGRHLRVANVESKFFAEKELVGGVMTWHGYTVDILEELALRMNFTYTIFDPSDGQWGGLRGDGTWTGMLGLLQRREVDLIISSLTINLERTALIDYTYSYFEDTLQVSFTPYNVNFLFYIFEPLKWNVWLLLLPIVAIVGFGFYCTTLLPREGQRIGIDTSMQHAFGVLFRQAIKLPNHAPSTRILLFTFSCMGMIIMATYTGNLIAALADQEVIFPFATLEEVAQDTIYHLVVVDGSVSHLVLKGATTGSLPNVYARLDGYLERQSLIQQVLATKEPMAFISDKSFAELTFPTYGVYDIQGVPETFFPSGHAGALPKGSPFLRYFSKEVLDFNERGLLKRWHTKHSPLLAVSADTERVEKPVLFSQVVGAFIALGCGLAAAGLAFMLEAFLNFR